MSITAPPRQRKSRAMDPEIKSLRAIKREIDKLDLDARQRVGEWIGAYIEGVGTSASARYGMALEAILTIDHYDQSAKRIARQALTAPKVSS